MAEPLAETPEAVPPEAYPAGAPPPAPPVVSPRRFTRRRVVLALFGLLAAWLAWEALTWPDVAALADERPETTAFIEAYRGRGWLGERRDVEWKWVSSSRISGNLKRAVLVGEDIGFFSHNGFAHQEMRSALEEAWEERRLPRGASTITQQLAKNLWLSPSRNPLRKVKEAILTWQLERELSKRRILEIYLNVVEFGPGIYGAEAACRHYFGKSARSLSEHQAAQLAASLPNPKSWHPGSDSRRYKWRVRMIERRMGKARWLRRVV
jgi:monofunctional biosynthetic peptidoglycan transglycosylase